MKKSHKIFAILGLVLGIEFFVFNFDVIESHFYQEQDDVDFDLILSPGLYYNEDNTISVIDSEDAKIELLNINHLVNNLYLNLEVIDVDYVEKVSIDIWLTDEGNQYNYYYAGEKDYLRNSENSHYFRLYSYGQVNSIQLDISDLEDRVIRLNAIEFNKKVPLHISWLRITGMIILAILIAFFRPKSLLSNYNFSSKPIAKPILFSLISLIIICEVSMLNCMIKAKPIFAHNETFEQFMQYEMLAESLSKGSFRLQIEPDQNLLELDNPYDPTARTDFRWDHAFYNNGYYVYFGVVPVLFFYLPYYLITGAGLENVSVIFLGLSLFSVGTFLLLYEIIKRYFPKTPVSFYLLFALVIINGSGSISIARKPEIYTIPIVVSLMLIVWGLWFWIRSSNASGNLNRSYLLLGSFCIALVAGCRPQMVLIGFLALPIFWKTIKNIFKSKEAMLDLMIALLPFFLVAGGLMYYNYSRFGSFMNFGANYNLTTNDMTKRGFNLARIRDGLYSYLFQIPNISNHYPFILESELRTDYLGITIYEPMFGGFFMTHIICFILSFSYWLKGIFRKKIFNMTLVLILISFVIVILDTEMAGILPRYISDFSFFLLLATVLVLSTIIHNYIDRGWIKFVMSGIALLCILGLCYDLFTFLIYDLSDSYMHNPHLFYKIMSLFKY